MILIIEKDQQNQCCRRYRHIDIRHIKDREIYWFKINKIDNIGSENTVNQIAHSPGGKNNKSNLQGPEAGVFPKTAENPQNAHQYYGSHQNKEDQLVLKDAKGGPAILHIGQFQYFGDQNKRLLSPKACQGQVFGQLVQSQQNNK